MFKVFNRLIPWKIKDWIAKVNRKEICNMQSFRCNKCWREDCECNVAYKPRRMVS